MKLAVYAIAKNEAKHVERWYDSVKDADEIVVLDTGSTDETRMLLAGLGVHVARMDFQPFRFDTARNHAMNLVSLEAEYCLFMDMDETLPKGSIAKIKAEIAKSHLDMYTVRLVYTFDSDRRPTLSYSREAVHKRNGFYWKYPVHELLVSYENQYSVAHINVDVFHEPDVEKPRDYLPLLEVAAEENPEDARIMQYLGREYMYHRRPFDAINWLKRHIQVETHGPFRSESAGYIADCYMMMDGSMEEALDEAEAWRYRAIAEFNSAREPYCELALLYFQCGAYERAIGMVRSALAIPEQPDVPMIHRDEYYQHWCYHMLGACYSNLGMAELARENIILAMQNAATIDSVLAGDLARILGIDHANQPVVGEAPESGERSIPEAGEKQTDPVPESVSEKLTPVPDHAESQGQDSPADPN